MWWRIVVREQDFDVFCVVRLVDAAKECTVWGIWGLATSSGLDKGCRLALKSCAKCLVRKLKEFLEVIIGFELDPKVVGFSCWD